MHMLLDMQHSQKCLNDIERVIGGLSLTKDEMRMEKQYRSEIEDLNQELYKAVDKQLHRHGQDTEQVDVLTGDIIERQDKLKEMTLRTETADTYRKEVKWLFGESKKSEGAIDFREDIFERIVESGIIHPNGQIVYRMKFGIEHSIAMTYQEYLDILSAVEKAAKREELLHSPEVRRLLEFCKEPQRFDEIRSLLNIESKTSCYKRIIYPLLDAGKLRRMVCFIVYRYRLNYQIIDLL